MSNARTLDLNSLKKVEPTQTLFFRPMPCEQQAANIRNKTVDAMKAENKGLVAYRFLQNRQGKYNTSIETALYSLYVLVNLYGIYLLHNSDEQNQIESGQSKLIILIPIILMLYSLANVIPNISNSRRYAETARASEEWLENKVTKKCLKDIKDIGYPTRYTKGSLSKLKFLLKSHNIETNAVSNMLERRIERGKRI